LSPSLSGPNGAQSSNQQQQQAPVGLHATVDTLKKGHLDAARATVSEGELRAELEEEIERDCESLRSFLQAAQVCVIFWICL
jgi:aspartate kinase